MIRAADLWMIGLRAITSDRPPGQIPTSGAGQPFREQGELFPRWAAEPTDPAHKVPPRG